MYRTVGYFTKCVVKKMLWLQLLATVKFGKTTNESPPLKELQQKVEIEESEETDK